MNWIRHIFSIFWELFLSKHITKYFNETFILLILKDFVFLITLQSKFAWKTRVELSKFFFCVWFTMKYAFKCAVTTCQRDGDRGFFRFPNEKTDTRRRKRWLENLNMEAVPFASARVCYKHFSYPGDISIIKSRIRT